MNLTELARKLKVSPEVLKAKLPELGFDIGKKAIKIDERIVQKLIKAWHDYEKRKLQEQAYLQSKERELKKETLENGDVFIPPVLTVKDFAQILKLPVTEVIKELMKNGVMASMNQRIDYDTAAIIATELGFRAIEIAANSNEELLSDNRVKDVLLKEKSIIPRAPVIVVMGHVDHGKTKLLDAIRKTDVVAGEAGGITQHIGAYQIVKKGRQITFIDTPGHEAFSAMRSRGAKVADIAILVVAANDGVKPQTVEALKIAQNSDIPIVVAINKIDLPDANVEKTKQDLVKYNLVPEEWGGKTIMQPISAKLGENIDELLEQVLLLADINVDKITANPKGEFVGSIIESHLDKGTGPVATVLVKNGTLSKGEQIMIDGNYYGKVRRMNNYLGEEILFALPSTPAQIIGLKVAPKVGDVIELASVDVKKVKTYKLEKKEETFIKPESDEDDENKTKLNIILRSDVLGSQEAIIESLEKLNNEELKIKFIGKGLGNITESDVLQAETTGAMLIAFNTKPSPMVEILAQEKKVVIQTYKIIYELIDAVKKRVNEIIKPKTIREDLGKLQVLKVFSKDENSIVVGGKVISGKIENNAQAAVLRNEQFITNGKIIELQSGKLQVTDVLKGQECGIKFKGQPLIEEGDIVDVYKETEIKKTI